MTSFTHYILDGTKVVAQYQTTTSSITPSNIIYFYYDESGSPTGMKYNGNVYFFQKNLQGDIIRILNTQGSIVATYTYDAWGNIIASTDTSGVSIGTKNPFRYRGYYYDTETGLYYLQSRYYDPQVGRFINADEPVLITDVMALFGYNMFPYCENNSINMIDYFGNDAIWLQDRNAVMGFGHTGLLIQNAQGEWFHFYWGANGSGLFGKKKSNAIKNAISNLKDISIQSINNSVRTIYSGKYENYIYFSGNFTKSLVYVDKLNNVNYNLLTNNCVQVSIDVLLKGTFYYKHKEMVKFLRTARYHPVPNTVYSLLDDYIYMLLFRDLVNSFSLKLR